MSLQIVCLILACICFLLDAVAVPVGPRLRLVPLGLFLFVLSFLVTGELRSP